MAEKKAALWGIVLAGGEGNRLKRFIQEYLETGRGRFLSEGQGAASGGGRWKRGGLRP